ncbi:MAG: hypothetical protein RJA22_561 [Verrucomicrobiota bacterium]
MNPPPGPDPGHPPATRLGRNRGGYAGETIDIEAVLADTVDTARRRGWSAHTLPPAAEDGPGLLALTRAARRAPAGPVGAPFRLYLSSGIHGDEPAGPLAMHQLVADDDWPVDAEIWLCPCLNPEGFRLGRRENRHGHDLNRQYLHRAAAETRTHVGWLERQPRFDVAVCLHEDWEAHGFYLYELNPDARPSRAEAMIQRVAAVCPIDPSPVIEGRAASGGIIRADADPAGRADWPEAFWLLQHRTRHSYTLEAPSDFPLATRVAALVTAVRTLWVR